MLSFLLKLIFVIVLGRLIGGVIRLALGRRSSSAAPPNPAPQKPQTPRHLGEDIVEADFEDLTEGKSP